MTARVRLLVAGVTALLLCIVLVEQTLFAWDQISHDGFLYALPARNQVFVFATVVMSIISLLLVSDPVRRRLVVIAAGALGAAFLLGTAVLSSNAWGAVCAVLVLLACWRLGEWILEWLRISSDGAARAIVALALGFALLSALIYVEGVTVGIGAAWTSAPVLLIGIVGGTTLWRRTASPPRQAFRSAWDRLLALGPAEQAAIAIALVVIGAVSIWTAAPDVMWDPNWGKAWLPSLWADTGQIAAYPFDAQTFAGGSSLYMATVGHLVGADAIGRYLELFIGVLLAGFAWRLCRPRAGAAIAAFAGLAFLVTPHVVWQMGTADDDLLLCLLAGALVIAVLTLKPLGWRTAVVMGVLAGGAINGKLHLLIFTVVMLLGWWVVLVPLRAKPIAALAAAGSALAIAGPQFLERWLDVGNPVFPALNNVFRSSWWPPVNESFNLPFGPPSGLGDLVRLPWTVVTEPTRYMEAVPQGVFGLLPVFLVVFVVTGWWQGPWVRRIIWAATTIAVLAWWSQLRYLRYLLPYSYVALLLVTPQLGVLASRARELRLRGRSGFAAIVVGLLAVVSAGTATATFFNIAERVPLRVAAGREAPLEYLARNMGGVRTVEAINHITPPGSRIVVDAGLVYQRVLTEGQRYLLPSWEFIGLLNWLRASDQATGGADDVMMWRRFHVGWIAVGVDSLRNGAYGGPLEDMIRRHGRLRWTDGATALYEVRSGEAPAGQSPASAEG